VKKNGCRSYVGELAWFTVVFGICVLVGHGILTDSSILPFGDESVHLRKVFTLQAWVIEADSFPEKLRLMALSGDAYPNLPYSFTLLFLGNDPSIERARLAQVVLLALHAGIGVTVGRRLWGRPAALAYVALTCFSPLILTFVQLYIVDVWLVAFVGASILFGAASDGFRRPGFSAGFVLCAAAALLVKWTAMVWLFAPVMACCFRAVMASSSDRRSQLGHAVRLVGVAGVGLVAIFLLSSVNPSTDWEAGNLNGWAHLAVMGLGLFVGLWVVVSSARLPIDRCVAAITAIVMMAGPWYSAHFHFLLERLAHEATTDTQMFGVTSMVVEQSIETLRLLVPGGELLLGLGVIMVIGLRRLTLGPAAWMISAVAGSILTIAFLPYNCRYFLPVVPLLAGCIVMPWAGLSHRKQWTLSALVIGMVTILSSNGALLSIPSQPMRYGWATEKVALGYSIFPVGIGRVPAPITNTEVSDWLGQLADTCERPVCRGQLNNPVRSLQARALQVMAKTRGIELQFGPTCTGTILPLGGLSSSFTVCE
jgi:hypothetical protein